MFIAVIDDEADLAYLFKDALSQIDGVQVFAFTDPLLALEHFKANHQNYMIIISDYRMTTMNEMELLSKIKDVNPAVSRIMMSAVSRRFISRIRLCRQIFTKASFDG